MMQLVGMHEGKESYIVNTEDLYTYPHPEYVEVTVFWPEEVYPEYRYLLVPSRSGILLLPLDGFSLLIRDLEEVTI